MDETPGIIMKDKLPNVLNSTKKHHKQIKKEILFAFFFKFYPVCCRVWYHHGRGIELLV